MAQLGLSHSRQISSGARSPQKFDRADFAVYRKVVRRHPAMAWAKSRSLDSDLEQLGLLEVLKVLQTYDSGFGTSPVQYVSVAMRSRMFSCVRMLQSNYCDKFAYAPDVTKDASTGGLDVDATNLSHDAAGDLETDATDPVAGTSYSGIFASSSVAANDELDRFTFSDEGESFCLEPVHEDLIDSVFVEVEATDQARQLMSEVNRLPTRQREIVELALQDYTDREIASALQITVQAVHKTKQKAITSMRTFMAGYMQ